MKRSEIMTLNKFDIMILKYTKNKVEDLKNPIYFMSVLDILLFPFIIMFNMFILFKVGSCNCGGNAEDHADDCPVKTKILKVRK